MKTHSVVLAAALFVGASLSTAKAGTQFDYVGNNFSYCLDGNIGLNSGCIGNRVTGHFVTSLSGNALDNLSDVFIDDTVLSIDQVTEFSFSDGLGLDLTKASTDSVGFRISTDAAGNLTKWSIIVQQVFGVLSYQNDIEILSAPSAGAGTDLSHHCLSPGAFCVGNTEIFESYPQGVWSRQDAAVPEPDAFSLFGGGLVVLGFAARSAKRKRRPRSMAG